MAPRRRLTRMNGAVWLHSCTSSSSIGSTWSTVCTQLFVSAVSGTSPPASIAVPATRRSSEACSAVSASASTPGPAAMLVSSVTEPASATGCALLVRPKVVICGSGRSGSGSSSASARWVYAPGHRGEAARGVAREPGGDRGGRTVPQQAQRDVHADLGAAAGEQRALAGQVGAGVPLGVVQRRARRAQLVVERVDGDVRLLADVAGP